MRKSTLAVAPLLAVALVAQCTPALAASAAPLPAPAAFATQSGALPTPGSAGDKNLRAWLENVESDPNKFDQNLEASCIESGSQLCSMSYQDIHRIPSDLKNMTEAMLKAIAADSELQSEMKLRGPNDSAIQARAGCAVGALPGNAVIRLAKSKSVQALGKLKDVAVQSLAKSADKIGDVASKATNASLTSLGSQGAAKNAQGGKLTPTEATVVATAKTVVYMTPFLGDFYSILEAGTGRDWVGSAGTVKYTTGERVEAGVVAGFSLLATGLIASCHPLAVAGGVMIQGGIALYYLLKGIFGWWASERDWVADPPGTPKELYESGASLEFDTHAIGDKQVALLLHETGLAKGDTTKYVRPDKRMMNTATTTQTLLLDSKWGQHNNDKRPVVNYEIAGKEAFALSYHFPVKSVSIRAWQAGKTYSGKCSPNIDGNFSQRDVVGFARRNCSLDEPLLIGKGKPAVVTFTITYGLLGSSASSCRAKPCVPRAYPDDYLFVRVLSESKTPVTLHLNSYFGVVDAPGEGK